MGILGDMVVRIKGDTGQLVQSLQGADKAVKKFSKLIMGGAAIGGAIMIFRQFGQVVGDTIKLINEQQEAEGRLANAIKATGRQASISVASIAGLANQLQQTTIYGDEATLSAAAMLQQLADLDEKGLRDLIPRVQNLASAMGMDLEMAASLVGKTLGSSTNALSRYGIMVDMSGSKSERLTELVKNLDEKFAGMADTVGQTTSGQLTIMQNKFSDLKQELAFNLLPTINQVLTGLNQILTGVTSYKSAKELLSAEGYMSAIQNLGSAMNAVVVLEAEIKRAEGLLTTQGRYSGTERARVQQLKDRLAAIQNALPTLAKQQAQQEQQVQTIKQLAEAEDEEEKASKKKFETTIEATDAIGDHTDALQREYEAMELTTDEIANLNGMLYNMEQERQRVAAAAREGDIAKLIAAGAESIAAKKAAWDEEVQTRALVENELYEIGQERRRRELEAEKEYQANVDRVKQAGWDLASTLVSSLATIQSNYYAGLLDNEELTDEQRKKILRQQAQGQKRTAYFGAFINTAEAITKALSSAPPPFNLILAAISAAAGAAQIAAISSQPLPKLARGGKLVRPTAVIGGEAGPEYFIPELELDELGGRIAAAMRNATVQNTIVNDQPIQLSVSLNGRQMDAYIQEQIANRRILVRQGAVTP